MSTYEKANEKAHTGNWYKRFDAIGLLSRLGLRTLGMKLFVVVLTLTGLSISLACAVAYFSFVSAIESSDQLQRAAVSTAEAVDLFLFEDIQFAKAIASDDAVVDAAERGAREAERLGLSGPPNSEQTAMLEERFKNARVLKPDEDINNVLREKRRVRVAIERMFFTDKYGLNVGSTSPTEDFVQSDEVWWKEAARSGVYIEDVKLDKPTNTFDIEVCVAILSKTGGSPLGVLKVKYNLQNVQEYIARFKQYETGYAYAISSNGRIVVHPDAAMRNLEFNEAMQRAGASAPASLATDFTALTSSQESGLLYYSGVNPKTKKTEQRIASFSKNKNYIDDRSQLQGFGWTFVVDNSKDEVYSPAYKMLSSISVAGLLSFLIFGGLALVFSKSFSGKITHLLAATDEVTAGNLDARVSIRTKDELERVAAGFNQMMDRLGEMVRNEKANSERLLETDQAMQSSLTEFLNIVSSVSEGNLTTRGVAGDDTLGRLVQAVNKMLDNFGLMLTEVKQIGLSVSSSATEILAAAEQIAVGSQRQADEITNTSSAVEEMAASMTQVSRNAEASAEAARRALDMAEHGDKSVRDTSEAMSRIDSAVQQTSEKMRLLGIRSSEISEIIDLINDIAAQTNLLALNAAIEAAHAGEAGLGFSVVADEIRKLAERSARATRDVGNLIKSIQTETSEALTAMEVGMKEVRGGSQLATQASSALQDISDAVRQSSELIEEISAASEEQARVTSNVAGAMQTISSITLETSAGAHQTAQTIEGMVGLADRLNKSISQFKVKDDYVHPFSYDVPASRGNGSTDTRYPHGD
ncbi:MAG TPA: methyl-accepting chemotaxis protein [Blastocatellia bacterium]|nr:methyl-accepting chemotaxis protein [Blastocatellia bacterium]